jgi:hypothetical protein
VWAWIFSSHYQHVHPHTPQPIHTHLRYRSPDRTNNTSEDEQSVIPYLFHFEALPSITDILAYNLRFAIWFDVDASASKQSTKKAFQTRFDTLYKRFSKKEINAKELLLGLLFLIGKDAHKMLLNCQFSVVSFFRN